VVREYEEQSDPALGRIPWWPGSGRARRKPFGKAPGIVKGRLFNRAVPMALCGLLAALGLIGAEHYVGEAHRRAEREAGARVISAAEALEENLLRTIEAVEGLQSLVQARHDLLARGSSEGAAAIEDHLTTVATQGKFGILQVAVIGADGMLDWSSVPGWGRVTLADREHYRVHRAGRQELFASAPLLGRASGQWSVQLTRPIQGRDAQFAGVAVVSLDPLRLSGRLASIHSDPNREAIVLRLADRVVIARSRDHEQSIGRSSPDLHPALMAELAATGRYLRTTSFFDGKEMVLAVQRVAASPLLVIMAEDWSVSKAALDELQRWVRLSYAGALLLGVTAFVACAQARAAQRSRQERDMAAAARMVAEATRAELGRILMGAPAVIYSSERPVGEKDPGRPARVRYFSPNAARVTGWEAADLTGPGAFLARMDEAGRAERPRFRASNIREGHATMVFRFRRPDGSWMWLKEEARSAGTTPDGVVQVFGYLTDVTAQRELELQAIASAKLASLGEMAAGMAHEMNQPLAIIALAAENAMLALEQEGAEAIPEVIGKLNRIIGQARRGGSIVHHLREFSRPAPAGPLGPVLLGDVLEGVLLLTRGALRDAKVQLQVDVPADLPPVVADMVGAEQVFVNLLLNARDALRDQAQDGQRRIEVQAWAEEETVCATVTDNGGGIAVDALPHLFEPFFTTKPPDAGSGLGLAICHGIMRSFGGCIIASNVPGGARFRLQFRTATCATDGMPASQGMEGPRSP
jgi:PAS domain S-box-containing protein